MAGNAEHGGTNELQRHSDVTAGENDNDENAILTNEDGLEDDPIRRGESTSAMAASPTQQQRPKSLEDKNSKPFTKNDDIITGTDSPNQASTPDNQRSGSSGTIESVNGSTKISKVDRPNTSSPLDGCINEGSKKDCDEPSHPIETEIALVSNPDNNKKVKRMPRYTYKTFDDCPCSFCRPKVKRPQNASQHPNGNTGNGRSDKDSSGSHDGAAVDHENPPQIIQPERKPVVIPRTQCEVKVVQVNISILRRLNIEG